jgi:predicted N-acetyltransferase YhbS
VGAWWAHWYNLPRHRWPRPAPDHTFDLDRCKRDRRRRRRAGQAMARELRVARLEGDGAPDNVWRWVAIDGTGQVVGRLAGLVRHRRGDGQREFMLCDIEVAPAWRRFGVGRRLVEALRIGLTGADVGRATVLIDEVTIPYGFFRACGFDLGRERQPSLITLWVAPSDARGRSRRG